MRILLTPVLALTITAGASPALAMPAPTPHPLTAQSAAPAASSESPVSRLAQRWLATMTATRYAHHYRVDTATGVYEFDCVGMVDHVVRRAAPAAWRDLHERLAIRRGYVPRPGRWLAFVKGERGPLPSTWARIAMVRDIRPGDVLLMGPNPATRFVGHAVIVTSAPVQTERGYEVRIIDSTRSPHGAADTRLTDPRAEGRSGLGEGTMLLKADASGALVGGRWSVTGRGPGATAPGTGPTMRGVEVVAARALR